MTNEELVCLAQNGDMTAIEQLYTQNRGIIYSSCRRFSVFYGYEIEDLMQEAYFILLKAVRAYSEDSGYKFTSFLSNSLKWYFPRYIRQDKNRKDLCVLDAPISEEGEITKADLLPDETAEFEEDATYNADMSRVFGIVKDAMENENNGEMKYNVLHDIFADGHTKTALGKKYNLSTERIRQIERDALRHLRNPKHKNLQAYREYVTDRSIHHGSLHEFKYTRTSSVEWAVLKLMRNQLNSKIYKI